MLSGLAVTDYALAGLQRHGTIHNADYYLVLILH
jgi:hypothetical protein